MTDPQYLRSTLLDLMAACGTNPIPQPLEYWRRQLATVAGRVSKPETEEALTALEEAGCVKSELDALSIRRYWITESGWRASSLQPRE